MRTSHPLSMTGIVCDQFRGHAMSEYELDRDVARCWCGAHSVTKALLFAEHRPWLTQPGWQVAVATRTPWRFRLEQAVARIFRR